MSTPTGHPLVQESPDVPARSARPVARVELIATIALALLTLIAVTAVSIGLARADAAGARTDSETATLAIALFIGLLLTGMGGLTAIMTDDRKRRD
jgi:hypothetical protein